MWRCPHCGESIDDVFDACWQCGTAADGTAAADFRAVPSDPDVPDPGPQTDAEEETDDSAGDPADARRQRVVELCSAADAVEAHALRMLLEDEGIDACVVGDTLGNAAGWLPLGEPIAPRLWVREDDAARGQAILAEYNREPDQANQSAESNEPATTDAGLDTEDARGTFAFRNWLSPALMIAGWASLVTGLFWAGLAWSLLFRYPATAEGWLVKYVPRFSMKVLPPSEIPYPIERDRFVASFTCDVQYEFEVDRAIYQTGTLSRHVAAAVAPIHYDPRDPVRHVVGPLTTPGSILAVALPLGGSFLLAGYWLAATRRRRLPLF